MELLDNKCDTLDGILLLALYMELLNNKCDTLDGILLLALYMELLLYECQCFIEFIKRVGKK